MIKIKGLDKLQRELKTAQQAFGEIDGELGSVNFDPNDPSSIEAAISQMEQLIDERLGSYSGNSIIEPMVSGMKEQCRQAIIDKAGQARLDAETD